MKHVKHRPLLEQLEGIWGEYDAAIAADRKAALEQDHAPEHVSAAEDEKRELAALTDASYYDPRAQLRYILDNVYELQKRLGNIEDVLYAALSATPRHEEKWHRGHDQEPKRRGNT